MTGIEQAADVVVIGLEPGSHRYRFAAVADFASRCANEMSRAGLELTVEHDMAAWARHMRSAVAADGVNPAFDPEHNVLSPDSCRWLRVSDEAGAAMTELAIEVVDPVTIVERIWELRDNVTSDDAAYLAVAEAIDAPLLTGDARLARATGVTCEVRPVVP
ncbi:MAG: type II toxin-antitoxin system VapC family toxin [Pseudonocardiaceae bacterium]